MSMMATFVALPEPDLVALRADPERVGDAIDHWRHDGPVEQVLELGKAWHGVHYLLTGDPDGGEAPLALAIFGGVELGPDLGYGPPRVLEPDEVRDVSAALDALPAEALRARFSPAQFEAAEIYPFGIWADEGAEAFTWLADAYHAMQAHYRQAAANGHAMLLMIT
jgi:hypothetical protein